MSVYPYPISQSWTAPAPTSGSPAPIYTIIITGLVLFMASNVMPNLLPVPERIFNVAPRVLIWGFWLIILTLLAQMTGSIPGVPQLHLTYVHMTVAALIFVLMWNQLANETPPAPPPAASKPSTSSSSSSSSSSKEKPKESKSEPNDVKLSANSSPWDDLRAHPSAFLTTRLNRATLWPFPMGKAQGAGPELWWESGTPSHVGHFNRPEASITITEPKDEKKRPDGGEKEAAKAKEKEREKLALKEAEKAKEAEKVKGAEKEAAEKKRKKEDEMKKVTAEANKASDSDRRSKGVSPPEQTGNEADERQKQKLWRMKALVMIVGISLLSKSLGFILLLFFSLQMISQELNTPSTPIQPSDSSSSAASVRSTGSSSSTADPNREAEKAKNAKMQAAKEAERAKVSASASGSGTSPAPTSSTDRDKEKEREKEKARLVAAREAEKAKAAAKSSSSSSSSSASASSTKDKVSSSSGGAAKEKIEDVITTAEGSPAYIPPGMGIHYIHTRGMTGDLDGTGAANIPTDGMPHPLMTSFMRGYAG